MYKNTLSFLLLFTSATRLIVYLKTVTGNQYVICIFKAFEIVKSYFIRV